MFQFFTFDQFELFEDKLSDAADEVLNQIKVNKLEFMKAVLLVAKQFNVDYKLLQKELSKRSAMKRTKKK